MSKIIALIIWTTVYYGYQVKSAIAFEDRQSHTQNQILLGDNSLLDNSLLDNNDKNADENLTKILILAGLVSGVSIIGWQISGQRQSPRSNPLLVKASNRALIDRVSPKLRRQLLRLINDRKTANRLLQGIHQHHRDRDPDWLAEKAIYDLRRGR
jgi:hypothetical protein